MESVIVVGDLDTMQTTAMQEQVSGKVFKNPQAIKNLYKNCQGFTKSTNFSRMNDRPQIAVITESTDRDSEPEVSSKWTPSLPAKRSKSL